MPHSPVFPGQVGSRRASTGTGPMASPVVGVRDGGRAPWRRRPKTGRGTACCWCGRSADHAAQGVGGPGRTLHHKTIAAEEQVADNRELAVSTEVGRGAPPSGLPARGQPLRQPQSERAMPDNQLGQPRNSMDEAVDVPGGPARERHPVAGPTLRAKRSAAEHAARVRRWMACPTVFDCQERQHLVKVVEDNDASAYRGKRPGYAELLGIAGARVGTDRPVRLLDRQQRPRRSAPGSRVVRLADRRGGPGDDEPADRCRAWPVRVGQPRSRL